MEKLAIVVPAYKARYLAETLSALEQQTNKNFNCYIADDASPEDLESIVNSFRPESGFSYRQFSDNLGRHSLPDQWRRSIGLSALEPWIWLLCDDDVPGRDCVEEFYKALPSLEQESINVFRFSTFIIDSNSTTTESIFEQPVRETGADFIARKLQGLTRSSLSEHIFRRNAYTDHGFINFPLAWHTDDAAWVAYSKPGGIFSTNNASVAIRVSEDSISGQVSNAEDKFQATRQFINWLLESGYINRNELSQQTWLYTYYGLESYYVNKLKPLTLSAFLQLWKLRMRCTGFWESLKIMKIARLLF